MSASLRSTLGFFQIGVVATTCSLAAACFVELIFPAYDDSRNRALQAIEGILGMTMHYLIGLELLMGALPLTTRAFPATVFAVLTPVMVPTSLAKMSGTMHELSEAVRPSLSLDDEDKRAPLDPRLPLRPAPYTPDYEELMKQLEDRMAEMLLDLKAQVASMQLGDLVSAEELGAALDALERSMLQELALMRGDMTRTAKAWAKHEREEFERKYKERNQRWKLQMDRLKRDFAAQWAALKAKIDLGPRCPGQPGCPSEPPIAPSLPTWDNPAEGIALARGSYAFTGDPNQCQKSIDGLAATGQVGNNFTPCGQQTYPLFTTNPATGTLDALTGCVLPNVYAGVPLFAPKDKNSYPLTPACYTCTPPLPNTTNYSLDLGNGKTQSCGELVGPL